MPSDMAGFPAPPIAGTQIGYARTTSSTTTTGASQIPLDGTIPQSNEGARYANIDTIYYPKRPDSLLEIEVCIPAFTNGTGAAHCIFALFHSGSASALATAVFTTSAADRLGSVTFKTIVAVSSLNPHGDPRSLFYINFGPASAVTMYIMRTSATDPILGALVASMTIREIAQ